MNYRNIGRGIESGLHFSNRLRTDSFHKEFI